MQQQSISCYQTLQQFRKQIHHRTHKFHNQVRYKHIEQYKTRIRKQNECMINLNYLLEHIPNQLEDVLTWCQDIDNQFNKSRQYKIPDFQIIQLFKIVQKFPCLQTIQLLYNVIPRMTTNGIHQLFQYDVGGLLHKLMIQPEKIVTRILISNLDQQISPIICKSIMKKSMLVVASLCEQNEKARNFMVINHKSFICVNKVYQKYQTELEQQFIICLFAFVQHRLFYDEQFVRIGKALARLFCHCSYDLNIKQTIIIVKSLTALVKHKGKWAMNLIQTTEPFNILQQMLRLIKNCHIQIHKQMQNYKNSQNVFGIIFCSSQKSKKISQLIHQINVFLIFYIQITTNQYFDWQSYFTEWFTMLTIENSFYQVCRRDVYFIFNNIICQNQQPENNDSLLRSLVFRHNCIHIFAKCLQIQINEEVLQQLSYCINSLLILKNVQNLAQFIVSSNLVHSILDAITRNFYSPNPNTQLSLIEALNFLIQKTHTPQLRNAYTYEIRCYENKLKNLAILTTKQTNYNLDVFIDKLLYISKEKNGEFNN